MFGIDNYQICSLVEISVQNPVVYMIQFGPEMGITHFVFGIAPQQIKKKSYTLQNPKIKLSRDP